MKGTVVVSVLLLIFSTGAAAQRSTVKAFADKEDGSSHDVVEIQGCLQRQQGYFILVDMNNEYERLSNNNALKKLVGHEVKLTGKPQIRSIDNTPAGGASNVIQMRYFQIKTVQDVAPNCHAYGR
jgi:hypothetical protein